MWQSRHSEVNVYFLALCEKTDGLFTFNGSPRSYMICVYKRLTDTGTQLENKSPYSFIGAFEAK